MMYDHVRLCTTSGRTAGTIAVTGFEGCQNALYDRTTKKTSIYIGVKLRFQKMDTQNFLAYRSKKRSYKSYKSYTVAIAGLGRTTLTNLGRTKSYK
jgi:hypothetical protein